MNWKNSKCSARPSGAASGRWCSALPILAVAIAWPLLTACSTPSATVVLDPRLTAPIERPELLGPTNRDIWIWAGELQHTLDDCAQRMDVIRGQTRP